MVTDLQEVSNILSFPLFITYYLHIAVEIPVNKTQTILVTGCFRFDKINSNGVLFH